MTMKTFSELNKLKTFKERYDYCRTAQLVGDITFGGSRWLNQVFYTSKEWKEFRNEIILRDKGCDLGIEGYDICGRIYIHHLNTITKEQLLSRDPYSLTRIMLFVVLSTRTTQYTMGTNPNSLFTNWLKEDQTTLYHGEGD